MGLELVHQSTSTYHSRRHAFSSLFPPRLPHESLTVSHMECETVSHLSKDIIQPLYFACEETKIVNGLRSIEQTKIQVFVYITFYPFSV